MDSGCRLRARTVGRRQQRAAPAWESLTSFAPTAFCTFKPFVPLRLDCSCNSTRYKEGQYRVFQLNLNPFMWTGCSKDRCIFFVFEKLTVPARVGFQQTSCSKWTLKSEFPKFSSKWWFKCRIWINRAEQSLKNFQPCSQAVKCKCIPIHWGSKDRGGKKDGKSCQIWHRFHGRADIVRNKDSVMKLRRRRRTTLFKSFIMSGWNWESVEEKEKSVRE